MLYYAKRLIVGLSLRLSTVIYRMILGGGKNCHFQWSLTIIGEMNIHLGDNVLIMSHSTIAAYSNYHGQKFSPRIEIEDDVTIGERAHVTAINSIIIKKGCLLGKDVTITDNGHGNNTAEELLIQPSKRQLHSKGAVIIGKDCWIGDKVTILPGVTIGDGCVIGANSVVTKSIPPYSICGGIPCKIIKNNR